MPDDLEVTLQLMQANADVVAATSFACEGFPETVSPEAILRLSNLAAAIGRYHQLRGEPEEGLKYHMLALSYLRAKRFYAPPPAPEAALYWVAARAMEAAAETAAKKRLPIRTLLAALDENIVQELEPAFTRGGLSGPRARAVLALLRDCQEITESTAASRWRGSRE